MLGYINFNLNVNDLQLLFYRILYSRIISIRVYDIINDALRGGNIENTLYTAYWFLS